MRCVCLQQFRHDFVIEVRDKPIPVGTEVLVRVEASGVCHSDLHIWEGGYDAGAGETLDLTKRGFILPRVLGHEIVGRIEAVGSAAPALNSSSSYVVCPWIGCGECRACRDGEENLCLAPRFLGVFSDGGHADYVVVPHRRYLIDIGDLNPFEAAPLACSGVTTFAALKKLGSAIAHGPTVIVGAGGLGLMAVSILRALGANTVVSVDIDDEKLMAAKAAGADFVINSTDPEAIEKITAACTGAACSIVDLVGSEATARLSFEIAGKGATIVVIGLYGGGAPWPLPLIAIKSLNIRGSYVGTVEHLRELVSLAKEGLVALPPVQSAPLEAAQQILQDLRTGTVPGRIVLDPSAVSQA